LTDLKAFLLTPFALIVIAILSVFFMNIHWKMIALKGFDQSNVWGMIFLILILLLAIPMFYFLGLAAFVGIIMSYIVLSLLKNVLGL